LGALFSVVVFVASQVSMLFRGGAGLSGFRNYFSPDQLANLAVVVNGAHGNSASVEPFTETGSMVDPHLYLSLLGRVAHWFGFAPLSVYNVAGIGLQILLVVGLSFGFAMITHRSWTAYFGALPYFFGTLGSALTGNWFTSLPSMAIVWGPFGEMFALNSQSAGLAIGALLLTLLLVVTKMRCGARTTAVIATVLGAGLGLLANIDTYSFFAALFFVAYGVAIYALYLGRQRGPVVASATLFILLFVLGGPFASTFGRVTVFALALLPALPGIWLLVIRWRSRCIAPLLAFIVVASPQLLTYVWAIHSGDPFLKFRSVSSAGLDITLVGGLASAAPLLLPLFLILLGGIHRKNAVWIAYSGGSMIAWFLISQNNLWGANQEPYQLWDIGFALIAFTIIPLIIDVALAYRSTGNSPSELHVTPWSRITVKPKWIAFGAGSVIVWTLIAHRILFEPQSGSLRFVIFGLALIAFTAAPIVVDLLLFRDPVPLSSEKVNSTDRWRTAISSLLMVSIGIAGISTSDWYHFYYAQSGATFSLSSPEYVALSRLSPDVTNHELVLTNLCINPAIYKDVTGERVAYYSVGLAGPSRVNAINKIINPKTPSVFTPSELKEAGIGWLVASNTCKNDWKKNFPQLPALVARRHFGISSQFVATLWKF
jgi:hypothetical protein